MRSRRFYYIIMTVMDPFAPWGRDGALFAKLILTEMLITLSCFFLYSLTVSYIFGTNEWDAAFLEISPHKKIFLMRFSLTWLPIKKWRSKFFQLDSTFTSQINSWRFVLKMALLCYSYMHINVFLSQLFTSWLLENRREKKWIHKPKRKNKDSAFTYRFTSVAFITRNTKKLELF